MVTHLNEGSPVLNLHKGILACATIEHTTVLFIFHMPFIRFVRAAVLLYFRTLVNQFTHFLVLCAKSYLTEAVSQDMLVPAPHN